MAKVLYECYYIYIWNILFCKLQPNYFINLLFLCFVIFLFTELQKSAVNAVKISKGKAKIRIKIFLYEKSETSALDFIKKMLLYEVAIYLKILLKKSKSFFELLQLHYYKSNWKGLRRFKVTNILWRVATSSEVLMH